MSNFPDALGLLELSSIARGLFCADAMVKKAEVRLVYARTVSPGKYLILVDGGVAEVDESLREGAKLAGAAMVDRLFLPQADKQTILAARGEAERRALQSVGVFETLTVASTLASADAAVKMADVWLVKVALAAGLGGKAYFVLTGEQHALEAALDAAEAACPAELRVGREIIPAPHGDLGGAAI